MSFSELERLVSVQKCEWALIPHESFLFYCFVYAVAIATPGPGLVAIVARALATGFRATMPACFGVAAGDLILMTLSAFGLSLIAQEAAPLLTGMKYASGAYLLYLGYRYWVSDVPDEQEVIPDSPGRGFFTQFIITLSNPKAFAFFVAIQPVAVDLDSLTIAGYLELVAATIVLIPIITMAYAATAARLRNILASKQARARMHKGSGLVMAGTGFAIMVR